MTLLRIARHSHQWVEVRGLKRSRYVTAFWRCTVCGMVRRFK